MDDVSTDVTECLKELCARLSNDKDGAFQLAVTYLASQDGALLYRDEALLCQRVRAKLLRTRSARDADKFSEYYQKLKMSSILKNRVSLLSLLYGLSFSNHHTDHSAPCNNALRNLCLAQTRLRLTTGTKSIIHEEVPLKNNQSTAWIPSVNSHSQITGPHQSNGLENVNSGNSFEVIKGVQITSSVNTAMSGTNMKVMQRYGGSSITSYDGDVTERSLIQEVIYAAQGIRSRTSLVCSQTSGLSCPKFALSTRLAELGFLHDRLKEFTDPSSGCMPIGLVGEGLVSALRTELTEYYRSIAILQTQLSEGPSGAVTLRRLAMWAIQPLHRLKWLATIAHAANDKKGGEMATCVHRFASHGDPKVKTLVKQLLTTVCYPLYIMLCRWLLDGEIDDPFNEFFIESRSGVSLDRMWHDKYRVRESMLPSFITKHQAEQILATGKSVQFMREACNERDDDLGEREALRRVLDSSSVELLFSGAPETKLHAIMSGAYYEASRRLLSALLADHKLVEHITAHRRYLLLGQGDFVHHLMRLMEPELNKPASQLYIHNLTCILEAAIRSTNAQYDDPEIISRLHVNLFPPQPDDLGWDVFSLGYRVEGPLGTLFPAATAGRYRALFGHLWRAKRMEHVLSTMWRHHTLENKRISKMADLFTEVNGLVSRVCALRAEAVRFCGELQHHAASAALEAAWRTLLEAAHAAQTLDALLSAHAAFLDRVAVGALLHHSNTNLQSYLRNVYTEILALREFSDALYNKIELERERRDVIEKLKAERSANGEYGITSEEESRDRDNRKQFKEYLAAKKADLNVLARSYRGHVKMFILKLALQNEVSLQTLSFRLDYNDFYKKGDSKLNEPLTYQHKRMSEINVHARRDDGSASLGSKVTKRK